MMDQLPAESDIATLPRWARVAFAARCARLVLNTLNESDVEEGRLSAHISPAIIIAERTAAGAGHVLDPGGTLQLAYDGAEMHPSKSKLRFAGAAAWRAGQAAGSARGARAASNESLEQLQDSSSIVYTFHAMTDALRADAKLEETIIRDFNELLNDSKSGNWDDSTAVSPDFFTGGMQSSDGPLNAEKLFHVIGVARAAQRTSADAGRVTSEAIREAGLANNTVTEDGESTAERLIMLDRELNPLFRVFISYRRADTTAEAEAIKAQLPKIISEKLRFESMHGIDQALVRRYTQKSMQELIFLDTHSIQPGDRIGESIDKYVDQCGAMIVLIGPRWDAHRLRDPDDWVRAEINAALGFRIPILLISVRGASIPDRTKLPEVLHPIADINALEMSNAKLDMNVLSTTLLGIYKEKQLNILSDFRSFNTHMRLRGVLSVGSFETREGRYIGETLERFGHTSGKSDAIIPHGLGYYVTKDGRTTKGRWLGGEATLGVQEYSDGDRFAGEFRSSKKHGLGTYFYSDGSSLSGTYRDDSCHGLGVYQSADGIRYLGEYRQEGRYCGICVDSERVIRQVCYNGTNYDLQIPIVFEDL